MPHAIPQTHSSFYSHRRNIELKTSKHEFTDRSHKKARLWRQKANLLRIHCVWRTCVADIADRDSANCTKRFVLFSYLDFRVCFACYPPTVFCKISVRRSKYFLKYSITWERLKISRWLFHSCPIFEAYLIKIRQQGKGPSRFSIFSTAYLFIFRTKKNLHSESLSFQNHTIRESYKSWILWWAWNVIAHSRNRLFFFYRCDSVPKGKEHHQCNFSIHD